MTGGQMPELGRLTDAAAQHIVTRLNEHPALAARVTAMTLTPPAPESVAAGEMGAEGEAERTYIAARALLVCALDHLGALRVLVVDAQLLPAYAHYTLLRGALEAALQARWALAGSARDRVQRGLALAQSDLEERRKVEESVGQGAAARQRWTSC